jgi:hypothetical protein
VQESVAAEQQRRLSTDDEYCKWSSAYESGAVIDLAESDGPAASAGAANAGAASGSAWELSDYDWSKGGDDDGGDGGDEADSGPRRF